MDSKQVTKGYPHMTREQLLEVLRSRWYLEKDEIDAILVDREFFQPYLRNALAKRAALGNVPEDPIDGTDAHAIFFLADLEDISIIPDLIRCLKMSDGDLELLYSDTITEHMWIPFAKVSHNSLEEIWRFATDPSVDVYARGAAVSGVIAMHHFHPERRGDAVTFVDRLLSRTDCFPVDHLAGILCECADSGLIELKQKAREFAATINDDDERFVMATGDDVLRAFWERPQKDFILGRAHDVYGVNRDWQEWSEVREKSAREPVTPDWVKEQSELVEEVKKASSLQFENDDSRNTPRPLKEQYELAMRFSKVIVTSERMEQLKEYTDADVAAWLLGLPFKLANTGLVREASEMGRVWANVTERANFLGDRAVILAEAGLKIETHEQIEENIRLFPDDVWIRIKVGDAHRALGELDESETCYRHVLTISQDDYDRAGVLERLIPMLKELGKTDEANALEAEEDFRKKKRNLFRSGKIVQMTSGSPHPGPKIARNDPCPCGSGKKYKKCHGR
jgi:tetratricopeptide (TPR) repeat protein